MRNLFLSLSVLSAAFSLGGCATGGRSTLFGAGAGAGIGAGIGAMVNPGPKGEGRIRNVFIGAAAGSLIGAGTGYLAHGGIEGREKEAFEKGKKEGKKVPSDYMGGAPGEPTLLPPRVEARFVDEQVRGNVYVPAHFEYVIVEPARWSR
jgi:hypothetical protein